MQSKLKISSFSTSERLVFPLVLFFGEEAKVFFGLSTTYSRKFGKTREDMDKKF